MKTSKNQNQTIKNTNTLKNTIKKSIYSVAMIAALLYTQNVQAQWSLTGNGGTTPGTNFIGTTDSKSLYFKTSNATNMAITSAGKVGIGTTSPANKLTVNGTANFTGNVGFGTTTPNTLVDINGGIMQVRPGGYVRVGALNQTTDNFAYFSSGGQLAGTGLKFETTSGSASATGATRMTILNNGNVGIGTTSPYYPLEIGGDANIKLHFLVPPGGPYYTSIGMGYGGIGNNTCSRIDLGFESLSGNSNSYITFRTGQSPYAGNSDITSEKMRITSTGSVGIGTLTPAYKLDVCGTIRAKEIRVETGWCDFVFADDYKLPALSEVESFIKENKHLPDVTKGAIIETEGLEVGKVSAQMIRKIEELTLYVIDLQKQVDTLNAIK